MREPGLQSTGRGRGINTPMDNTYNAATGACVPGGSRNFFEFADLGQIGFRPLSACAGGRAAGVLTADGGLPTAFVNDFKEVSRHWRHAQGRSTRRPPRMPAASAAGTAIRPQASRLGAPPINNNQR